MESTLKAKWREVVKLDTMEKDLNKLKYLSELPNMFKVALSQYQAGQDLTVFDSPTRYYSDYSDILTDYKQTKFMLSLYGEIKSYVERIKSLLNKALEGLSPGASKTSEETKLLVQYLLILGEDRNHLRNQFALIKQEQVKILTTAKKPFEGTILDQLSSLHESANLDFFLCAIRDYKTLFLSPQKAKVDTRESIPHRLSQVKIVLSFKHEAEEKQELRELKKFLAALTNNYFTEV